MKKNIHPEYRTILYKDSTTGDRFLCRSTQRTTKTDVFDGVEYPLFEIPTSSLSHPFFTGDNKPVDSEGRVSKFKNRYANKNAALKAKDVDVEDVPATTAKKATKKIILS